MKAAIYSRISRSEDDNDSGVKRHAELCRKECESRGWEVVKVYEDNDTSAVAEVRIGFDSMLRDMRAHKFEIIVAYEQSRIARDVSDWDSFRKQYKKAGLSLIDFVNGGIQDLASAQGGFVSNIMASKDASEREIDGQRIRDKKAESAAEGYWNGGVRPFGYEPVQTTPHLKQKNTTLRVVEAEAVLIREATDRVLQGGSLYGIASDWNRRGIRTVNDAGWQGTQVRRILQRPGIAGLRDTGGEIVGETAEAILDRGTWERLQKLLSNPTRRPPVSLAGRVPFALRGILRCEVCKRPLTAMYRGDKRVYGCRPKMRGDCGKVFVRADDVEGVVLGRLVPLTDDPRVRALLAGIQGSASESVHDLVQANADDEAKLLMLGDMVTDGDMARADYVRQAKRLRERVSERLLEMQEIQGIPGLDQYGSEIMAHWSELTDMARRAILLTLVSSVDVLRHDRANGNRFDENRLRFVWTVDAFKDILSQKPYGLEAVEDYGQGSQSYKQPAYIG